MPSEFSFDAVSEVDLNLVNESIAVAMKEIGNRYDFKDSNASLELNEKDKKITVRAKAEMQVEAAVDVLFQRLAKRNIPLKNFKRGEKIEQALGQTARLEVAIQSGIPVDKAKKMIAALKESKIKVNASIQSDQLRVSSKSKDELQQAMALLRSGNFEVEVQFKNFR